MNRTVGKSILIGAFMALSFCGCLTAHPSVGGLHSQDPAEGGAELVGLMIARV